MNKKTFAERCQLAQQLLPDAQYRAMLTKLHDEMLAALAEQPAQQAEINRLVSFNQQLMDEVAEQCRINGMSAEREERLKSKTAVAEHTIQQLVTALEGSGTKMRSDQWYIEIEAVAAGKHYLNKENT